MAAVLSDGTKINSSEDLLVGTHTIAQGEIHGYKYFYSCTPQRTFNEWLKTGGWYGSYQEYEICSTKVTIGRGADVVATRDYFSNNGVSSSLRTNKYTIGEIMAPDDTVCKSAISPFR